VIGFFLLRFPIFDVVASGGAATVAAWMLAHSIRQKKDKNSGVLEKRAKTTSSKQQPQLAERAAASLKGTYRPFGGSNMQIQAHRNFRTRAILAGMLLVWTALSFNANADEKKLYDRLGGYEGISAVVDMFADSLFADPKIKQFFVGMSDDTRNSFKQKNKNLLCNATGGQCQVISRPADQAHHGLGITEGDFDVVAGHLKETLDHFKVPAHEQDQVFAIILSLKPKIVDRPDQIALSKDSPVKR
jgi:hemoglobin